MIMSCRFFFSKVQQCCCCCYFQNSCTEQQPHLLVNDCAAEFLFAVTMKYELGFFASTAATDFCAVKLFPRQE